MPLSKVIKRQADHPRRIAWISTVAGLIFFLVFSAVTLFIIQHKRAQQHDRLVNASKAYMQDLFNNLEKSLMPLLKYTDGSCQRAGSVLTSRAAFINDIRTILLVHDGQAWCSSATGTFLLPVSHFSPLLKLTRPHDIVLVGGTPMLPHKPAILLWLQHPEAIHQGILATLDVNITPLLLLVAGHESVDGLAIASGDKALLTWSNKLVPRTTLPARALRQFTLPGYALTFYLYGEELTLRDIAFVLIAGLLLAVVVASASWLLFSLRLRPGKEILLGIKRNEFHVVYQPLLEAASGRVYGLEALLRWTHPVTGPIPPDAFINYAESQNMIVPLTRHLFRLVAQDAQLLRCYLPPGTIMGLNIAPGHLSAGSFHQDVNEWIAAMPPAYFDYVFEITERTMVAGKNVAAVFDWLHQQNITIAIDDFGTGHSALIYLEKFNFDYLKIDRGFVQSIGMETVTSPVLDAVLTLARKLNLKTVAEGVETEEQAAWLIKRGVSHMQGYLFSRPLPPEQLISYLQQQADAH
ncbi:cyclic di-GMP phosphodiesterase [Erwinia sp. PK3-005]